MSPYPEEEYYLGKSSWSATASDWDQRFEVGDVVADPSGSWTPGTAEAYIDQQVATVTSNLASETLARQTADQSLQNQINAEATTRANVDNTKADKATTLAGYGITNAYTKTEVNGLVDTPHQNYVTVQTYSALPASGSADTIYRVSNYDGSVPEVNVTKYSEYAWNGSQYIFLCVKSQIDEIFDITVYNSNTTYADLAAALSGTNVPTSLQRGGMSVKFVKTSDNKYVQYRLMKNTWSVTVSDWQGVDNEPIGNSENLVNSGGIISVLNKKSLFDLKNYYSYVIGFITTDGSINPVNSYKTTDYIKVNTEDIIDLYNCRYLATFDSNKTIITRYPYVSNMLYVDKISFTITTESYIRVSYENSVKPEIIINGNKNIFKNYFYEDYDRTIGIEFKNGYWNRGAAPSSTDYKHICIPVNLGETLTAYPSTRFLQYYDENWEYISSDPNENSQGLPITFTPPHNGYAFITFYASDVDNNLASVYKNSNLSKIGHGYYISDKLITSYALNSNNTIYETLLKLLKDKTIVQFGDSIMQGSGASNLGIGERFAQKYGLTCLEYSVGGATMGYKYNKSHILDQVNSAISDSISPDIILLNGGTNDMHGDPNPQCVLGEITNVYTEPADANTFSSGFESVSYKIKVTWPNAIVIFIRAHNMSSRMYDRQITYGEQGIKIAEKWGIGVIDMYKIMNTQLPYYQTTYLVDSTHPNAAGYEHFYIPALEQYLYKMQNIL